MKINSPYKVAFTYIGTVIGAGFATGQEIMRFFTFLGANSSWAICLSMILFIWLGNRIMTLGYKMQATSYLELNRYLFGTKIGFMINVFIGFSLLIVCAALLAGVGALFYEQFNLPEFISIIFTLVLAYCFIIRGIKGVMFSNLLIVPLMIILCIIFLLILITDSSTAMSAIPAANGWYFSSLVYCSFNLSMAQAVLVPLGAQAKNIKIIRLGSFFGGILLGFLLLINNGLLYKNFLVVKDLEVPLGYIVANLGILGKIFFVIVVWGEIFTTLVANIFGLSISITNKVGHSLLFILLALCYILSLIGFTTIVHYIYPILGYIGLVMLLLLVIKSFKKEDSVCSS